jgi:putative nucleotidyltransferase with HDIG domain
MSIRARPVAGWWAGLTLSVLFAALLVPLATFDLRLGQRPVGPDGKVVGFTVRLPGLSIYRDLVGPPTIEYRRMLWARGETLDPKRDVPLVAAWERGRRPPDLGLLLGLCIAYLLTSMLYGAYLRNFGARGRLLRTQVVLLGALLVTTAGAKAFLLLTALPPFLFPLGALSIAVAVHHDRQVAFATTVVGAMVVGSLVPFDLVAALVLLMQGFGAVLMIRRAGRLPRPRALVAAGVGGGAVAAMVYVAIEFLIQGHLPAEDLSSPATSGLLASFGGGVGAGALALGVAPLLARALGHLSTSKLIELADLNHPLLRQIAERSPGTWAHSLAMANLAEVAATAIGADALLTRVGAYYHDLGKSLHPSHYIENLRPGEASPHDAMSPEASAEAIFAHCSDGVRLGRREGLPEPVLDFMHMHHGNGLLEYFFHKNQELGNPKGLTEAHFRYPGVPPQSKETAILAICDAVEAASRTLKEPDERSITHLVQRIVFGKLRLGQLDESGLTSLDLKLLSNSLIGSLRNSFHVRIEYPWQRDEREKQAATLAAGPPPDVQLEDAAPRLGRAPSPTQRLLIDARLDSADVPRPPGAPRARSSS